MLHRHWLKASAIYLLLLHNKTASCLAADVKQRCLWSAGIIAKLDQGNVDRQAPRSNRWQPFVTRSTFDFAFQHQVCPPSTATVARSKPFAQWSRSIHSTRCWTLSHPSSQDASAALQKHSCLLQQQRAANAAPQAFEEPHTTHIMC
jgi:hypothetical protein